MINTKKLPYYVSSTYKVYETKHAEIFTVLEENRNINQRAVKKIRDNMEKYGLLPIPLLVYKDDTTNKLYCIDGEHRKHAYQQLKDNKEVIYFIIVGDEIFNKNGDGNIMDFVRDMNNSQHSWSLSDYIDSNRKNKPEYQYVYDLKERFTFITYTQIQRLLESDGKRIRSGGIQNSAKAKKVDLYSGDIIITKSMKNAIECSLEFLSKYAPYLKGFSEREEWYAALLALRYPEKGMIDEKRLIKIFEEGRVEQCTRNIYNKINAISKSYNKGLKASSPRIYVDNRNRVSIEI